MKIANIFKIHLFMDLHNIYLKQDTFVCGSEMWSWNLFLFMDLFYISTYWFPFVCALKCICEKSHLGPYINHKIHLWILLCAFIINETEVTPYGWCQVLGPGAELLPSWGRPRSCRCCREQICRIRPPLWCSCCCITDCPVPHQGFSSWWWRYRDVLDSD